MVDKSIGIEKNVAVTVAIGHFYKDGAVVSSPTLAAGDVKIHIGLTGNEANIGSLPTAIGDSTTEYKQAYTQAETNEDDIITNYRDAAGAAWDSFSVILNPATNRNDELATVGADSDTLETLSDQLDGVATLGAGAVEEVITVTDGTDPLDGAEVWASTDAGGNNIVASGSTDSSGEVTFMLDAGTYYVWVQHAGYNATNPATVVVS